MSLKRISVALLLSLLALGAAPGASIEVLARHGRSVRGTIDGVPFLLLRGTAAERGFDHGVLGGRDFLRVLDEALLPLLEFKRPGTWDKSFVGQVGRFSWPPRFQEEMAGFMAGLAKALPKAEDRVLKVLKREVSRGDLQALNALTDIFGAGCSSFAAWGDLSADGRPIAGRNLDYAGFPMSGLLAVIAEEPAEPGLLPTIDFMAPGFLGSGTAMNGEGVFVAMHDEAGLAGATASGWVPRSLALRIAVETARGKTAIADLSAALRRLSVKVGNNLLVAGPEAPPVVLEWDGNPRESGVSVREAVNATSIVCTNHYLKRAERPATGDSAERHAVLTQGLGKGGKVGLEEAKGLLSSVGRDGPGVVTHLSVVAQPATRRLSFTFSPGTGKSATGGRWVSFGWDELFKN